MRPPIRRTATRKREAPWRPRRASEGGIERKSAKSPQKDELGNSEPEKLPPNQNVRKQPEVYGDTEIPERKE